MKLHRLMNFDTDVFDGACIFSVFFFFFLEKKKRKYRFVGDFVWYSAGRVT